MRLIDADMLGLTDMEIIMCDGDYKEALKMLIDKINNAPTIEPERNTGKWMWYEESRREYPYKCSECGAIDYYAFLYDTETRAYKQQDNFCPNCGADMRGEQNGND